MKLRVTGTEYSERISNANLLDLSLVDLHIFLRSNGKRVNVGALDSVRVPTHRSCPSVATAPSLWRTLIPDSTLPKIVCLLSRNGVGARVRKNWEPEDSEMGRVGTVTTLVPLVSGPELAIAKIPAPVNRNSALSSSSL